MRINRAKLARAKTFVAHARRKIDAVDPQWPTIRRQFVEIYRGDFAAVEYVVDLAEKLVPPTDGELARGKRRTG